MENIKPASITEKQCLKKESKNKKRDVEILITHLAFTEKPTAWYELSTVQHHDKYKKG
jgi:hypothetical protein